jgi:putative ABC transport system ATP-binding protein
MSTVLEARGLVRRYAGEGSPIRAVDGVDLVVEAGEAVSVMGPSGCGKSTLLHLLGGSSDPTPASCTWAARRRAMELLERLGVAARAGHLPDHLSGGEQQRVAVARALINQPLVLLADEPTGNLDSRATGDILRLFGELGQAGQALLTVTHDARVASTADRLLTMRDGAIVAQTRLGAGTSVAGLLASLADLGGER